MPLSFHRRQVWSVLRSNIRVVVVLSAAVAAYFLPNYLQRIGHNPPAGVYIAIMGLLAAIVTFLAPERIEKGAWILLFTLLVVAEIRNLYIADSEQLAKFAQISSALDSTKMGLDATATGIKTTSKALELSMENSQTQFSSTMARTKLF